MISSEASQTVRLIPTAKLRENPWNRTVFDPVALDELVASIRTGGIEEPLIVRPGPGDVYEIASGHRRWLAAQKAGLKEVPCIVRQLGDKKVAEMNIEVNLQREDIPPLELARMVNAYIDRFKLTQMQAATEFGKSQAWVSGLLAFLKMPASVLENIRALIIGWDPLAALQKAPEEIQLKVSQEIKEGTLRPVDIERRCRQLSGGKSSGRGRGPKLELSDPLQKFWEPLRTNHEFSEDVLWDVQYKGEGWSFFAQPIIGDPARTLAVWFRQMAVVLEGGQPPRVESQVSRQTQELHDRMAEVASTMSQPRLPQNDLEEKELAGIARAGTPEDVMRWIYGAKDPRAAVMRGITWKEYGKTPDEGVRDILEGLRTQAAIDQQRAKGKIA